MAHHARRRRRISPIMIAAAALHRGAWIALLSWLLTVATAAWAQDPQSGLVQRTSRDWLVFIDKDDGAASWKAAGKKFQNAMSSEEWTKALASARQPLGKMVQRAMVGTTFDKTFGSAP